MPNACKLANSAGTEKHENTYFSHCQTQSHKLKDRLSQQTDGQTNKSSHRVACPRLKKRMTNQLNGLTNRDSQKTNEQTDQQTSIHSNMYPTNRPTNQPTNRPTDTANLKRALSHLKDEEKIQARKKYQNGGSRLFL